MKYFILFLTTAIWWEVDAQDFSLGDCIDFTLKNHPAVSIYENNMEIAKNQTAQSIALYLPQVNGVANFTDNMKLQTTVLPAGTFGQEPTEVQFGTQYNTTMGIDFSQTLYDQSKIVGIKASQPYEQMTQLQKEQNTETLVYNTATAYFQVMIHREQLNALTVNQAKYEELLQTMKFQQSKGVLLEKDVNRIQVNLNATQYQIEDVTRKHNSAFNSLKNAMGMALDSELELKNEMDYESFAKLNINHQLEMEQLTAYKINQQVVALQEVNVQMQKAKYTPTLNLVGKYAYQSMSNEYSSAFSNWNDFSYIGLSLKIPIFNGMARTSKYKEEQFKLDNERHSFLMNQRSLKLNYENAYNAVETAFGTYKSNLDNLNLSKELLEVTEYQYKQGTVGLIDYLNDDMASKNAQSNYINSLYSLMISHLNYQKAQGTLVEFSATLK